MTLERVTKIELNIDEQRRITLDYLTERKTKNAQLLNQYEKMLKYRQSEYIRTLKNELAAIDAVIKILEKEI